MKPALVLIALSLVACSSGVESQSDATSTSSGGTDAGMRAPGWSSPVGAPRALVSLPLLPVLELDASVAIETLGGGEHQHLLSLFDGSGELLSDGRTPRGASGSFS